jgi:hypothetical protein
MRQAKIIGRRNNRKGMSLIWAAVVMVALCAIGSFAVDYGRVQIVKTQLRAAADAAARAAAHDMPTSLALASASAVDYARRNLADGQPVVLDPALDIEYGKWNLNDRKFKTTTNLKEINAVHVIARRVKSRNTAVPLTLASVIGAGSCDVKAETIVMVVPGVNVNQKVQATANPFLAGMPPGTVASAHNPANSPDVAGTASNPLNSPQPIDLAFNEGEMLNFNSIDGTARHDPTMKYWNPDGDLTEQIGHNNGTPTFSNNYSSTMYNENHIADAWIPINSLVGVFLDDKTPLITPTPQNMDFRTTASRDFESLQPGLQQLFFIGDGLNTKGQRQNFQVPKGATRLFLATMDYFQWNNNAGYRTIKIIRPEQIVTVK